MPCNCANYCSAPGCRVLLCLHDLDWPKGSPIGKCVVCGVKETCSIMMDQKMLRCSSCKQLVVSTNERVIANQSNPFREYSTQYCVSFSAWTTLLELTSPLHRVLAAVRVPAMLHSDN